MAIIIARVNAHLGWRCVEKVAFRQGPLPPMRQERRILAAPSADAEAEASKAASSVEDEALRAALTRLGARAIDLARAPASSRTRREGRLTD